MNKTLSSRTTKAASAVRAKTGKLADDAENAATRARTGARGGASKARAAVADRADEMADGLNDAGDGTASLPRVSDGFPDGVSRINDSPGGRGLSDVMQDAQDFARRNPAVVVVGALIAGLVLSRVVRSPDRKRR